MSIKFLIINNDYPQFQEWLYARNPGLEQQPYEEQMRVRMDSLFGVADFYSSNLCKLGYEAYDIYANNEFAQKAWARETGLEITEDSKLGRQSKSILRQSADIAARTPLRYLRPILRPVLKSLGTQQAWFYDILAAQIKYYKPDVLLNQGIVSISSRFLKEMKPYARLLVGQHAATRLPDTGDWGCYDLVISSFPPTIDYFHRNGIPAELHRLGFESTILPRLEDGERTILVSFVGSFYTVHQTRTALLESMCARFKQMSIWGQGIEHLAQKSSVRQHYVGQAWGQEMYQILSNSKITLNHHGDIAPYANNARLYEATGVGTLLITDWKENLHEMFEPGKEVVAYRNAEECAELIKYYLEHGDEREAITHAGQERTLKEHTYYHRMKELVDIIRKYL